MISLDAISVGYAVPNRDFNTTVHSVFHQAANLQTRKRSRLFTLVTAECADLPQGIRLQTPAGFSFERVLYSGERIFYRSGILVDEHEHLSIDLRHAKLWKYKLPEMDTAEITPQSTAAWKSVWQALDERQALTGAEIRVSELFRTDLTERTALTGIMGAHIRSLVEATRSLDSSVGDSIAGLIGLGTGLTPSGDDFLVGFMTGLRCMTLKREERLTFLSKLGKTIVCMSHKTNDISGTYLYHATLGQVSSKLAALVEEITRGEDFDRLLQVAEAAMEAGHTSGMDTVSGILIGLSTWGNGFPKVYKAFPLEDSSSMHSIT